MKPRSLPTTPWPPAFSESFLRDASDLFADNNVVLVVGAIGSNRGTLASLLTGADDAAVWWRREEFRYHRVEPYRTINRMFPTLLAEPGDDTEDVVAALRLVLKRRVGRPTLLVREADQCDAESIAVLSRLAAADEVRLVATMGPSSVEEHPLNRDAARIDLAPLTDQIVAHLLQLRFDARPHPTVVAMLAQRSQGAYAVLRDLADAAWVAGQIVVKSGALVADTSVPLSVVDDVAQYRLNGWAPQFGEDHPAADLFTVAALVLELDAREAVTIFGDEAVQSGISSGVLASIGDAVAFRSHSEAILIQRSTDLDRRRYLNTRYGRRLQRTARRELSSLHLTAWLLSIEEPLDVELATRAAGRANRQGRYATALQIAAAVPAGDRSSRLVIEMIHASNESGDDTAAAAALAATDPATIADDDLFPFLRWTSSTLGRDRARAVGKRIATASDDPRRLAVLELSGLYGEVFQDCSDDLRRRIMHLAMSGRLSTEMHAVALIAAAGLARHTGRASQGVDLATTAVDMLRGEEDVSASTMELALEALVLCHLSDADLVGAERVLTEYSAPGAAYGNFGRLGSALWGLLEFFRSDLGAALANARVSVAAMPASDPHHMRGWVEAMLAQILVNVGATDEARTLLVASESYPPGPRRQHHLERLLATACAYDVLGEPERALELLWEVAADARDHGLTLLEIDAAVLITQIGGPPHLSILRGAVEGHEDLTGTCRIWERFAEICGREDTHGLVELANELRKGGTTMFAAEVAQFALDLARPTKSMTPAEVRLMESIAAPMSHRTVML